MSSAEARTSEVAGYARDFRRGVMEMASEGSGAFAAMAAEL